MKVYYPVLLINHMKFLIMKDNFQNWETFSLHESLKLGEETYKYLQIPMY